LEIRSLNLRGGYEGLVELGSREQEVDIFCLQEVGMGKEDKFYELEGYGTIGGVGGYIKKEEGSVVSILIRNEWKGRYVVLGRCQWKIGNRLEVGKGKIVNVWNVYLRQGKHEENLGRMEDKGNVVWVGDFNAWSERRGGEKGEWNRERVLVEDWVDEWGLKIENEVGVGTRYEARSGKERVLDLAVNGGGVELDCKVGEGIVDLDHKPLVVKVKVEGWEVEDKGWKK